MVKKFTYRAIRQSNGVNLIVLIGLIVFAASNVCSAVDLTTLPDPINNGVIRVWRAEGNSKDFNRAGPGDALVVEVKNFDGWLMEMLDYGRMTEAPLVRNAPLEVKKLINGHTFRFAVAAAVWMENYEREQLEKTQTQPESATELAALRKFYLGDAVLLKGLQPPP